MHLLYKQFHHVSIANYRRESGVRDGLERTSSMLYIKKLQLDAQCISVG